MNKPQFVKLVKLGLSHTEGHSSTDNFWTFFHVTDGSNRQPPVCYWAPEVLKMNETDQSSPMHLIGNFMER